MSRRKTTRRSLSISGEAYARLAEAARDRRTSVSQLCEQLVQFATSGELPIEPGVPSSVRSLLTKAKRGSFDLARYEKRVAERDARAALVRQRAELRRSFTVPTERVEPAPRYAVLGPPRKQFPPRAFCGVCANDCRGPLYQEPIGKDGGMVNVCDACRQSPEVPAP